MKTYISLLILVFLLFGVNLNSQVSVIDLTKKQKTLMVAKRTIKEMQLDLKSMAIEIETYFNLNGTLKKGYEWCLYADKEEYQDQLLATKKASDIKKYCNALKTIKSIDELLILFEKYPDQKSNVLQLFEISKTNFAEYLSNDKDRLIYIDGTEVVYTKKSLLTEPINSISNKHKILDWAKAK